ncbi:MAG: hypothetical protein IJ272_11030 [Clostridia bacterium]|nr:hypothetical protein [Clostridia bacterium]
MILKQEEKKIIIDNTVFLKEKGYVLSKDDYAIIYSNNKEIEFRIGSEPYEDFIDISINFKFYNEFYSIRWIAYMEGVKIVTKDREGQIYSLVDYLYKNYHNIVCREYCKKIDMLIEQKYGDIQ